MARHHVTTLMGWGRRRHSPGRFNFHLVQCERDQWQAFMEGQRAPLSDHVPLKRALEVVYELAEVVPKCSLELHPGGTVQLDRHP